MRESIRLIELHPYVRYAACGLFAPGSRETVCAADCRIFYLCDGSCRLTVGDKQYTLSKGSSAFIPAGVRYRLEILQDAPRLFCVNFDFTCARSDINQPLPLLREDTVLADEQLPPLVVDCEALNQPLILTESGSLLPMLRSMEREFVQRRRFYEHQLSADMLSTLTEIIRLTLWEDQRQPNTVDRMIEYIQEHYAEALTNVEIAAYVNYHPVYANRLMRVHTGKTLHQYLLSCRIQRSLNLLLNSDLSITDIALQTGFSSVSRFTKDFRQTTGHTPSYFRRSGGADR